MCLNRFFEKLKKPAAVGALAGIAMGYDKYCDVAWKLLLPLTGQDEVLPQNYFEVTAQTLINFTVYFLLAYNLKKAADYREERKENSYNSINM